MPVFGIFFFVILIRINLTNPRALLEIMVFQL